MQFRALCGSIKCNIGNIIGLAAPSLRKIFKWRVGKSYQSKPFDVVITDLIMPEMEGIETMMRLRKLDPGVKVIAISGGGRNRPDEYLHMATKLGALSTFKKPVDRTALLYAAQALVS
jgi:DNA-binding NtrC family response regulator